MSVVPVSTMPAVLERIDVDVPYLIDWLMPKNREEGDVLVIGLKRHVRHAEIYHAQQRYVREGNRASELRGVSAAESEFTIDVVELLSWLKRHRHLI